MFQSTHPRGVRREENAPARPTTNAFQSTHPRGVRPFAFRAYNYIVNVSIHAPAWGATHDPGSGPARWNGFQSTHPRGVRRPVRVLCAREVQFQSTHPRGVRRAFYYLDGGSIQFQSTHPRGVRRRRRIMDSLALSGFNPRTRVGCDEKKNAAHLRLQRFQSTHPRGVRLPTPATGWNRSGVSIHAPAWGATAPAHGLHHPV